MFLLKELFHSGQSASRFVVIARRNTSRDAGAKWSLGTTFPNKDSNQTITICQEREADPSPHKTVGFGMTFMGDLSRRGCSSSGLR